MDKWRLYNVASTSMQRHNIASKFMRRCLDMVCMYFCIKSCIGTQGEVGWPWKCFNHGKRELILVLFVRLFDYRLFGFVCFLFLLVSGKGCGLCFGTSWTFLLPFFFFFSSPEHEVLMVSYCGQSMSVVRRALCVVRRPSCVVRRAASTIALKAYSSYTPWPIDSILGRKHQGDL